MAFARFLSGFSFIKKKRKMLLAHIFVSFLSKREKKRKSEHESVRKDYKSERDRCYLDLRRRKIKGGSLKERLREREKLS